VCGSSLVVVESCAAALRTPAIHTIVGRGVKFPHPTDDVLAAGYRARLTVVRR
jgi:hypothetical protein